MALAVELVKTGLATANPYEHLTLDPALCPYLGTNLDDGMRETHIARWLKATRTYVRCLCQDQNQNAKTVAKLTALDLPNLFALLEYVERAGGCGGHN